MLYFKEIRAKYLNDLKKIYTNNEIIRLFNAVMMHFYKIEPSYIALYPDKKSTINQSDLLINILNDLKKNKPLQYITNSVFFYKNNFYVNESVLIPRPETEELIQWLLDNETNSSLEKKILDIGSGSGCIPISLKLEKKKWKISSIDICEKALEVAKQNSINLDSEVKYFCRDIMKLNKWIEPVDIIISNPPYLSKKEKKDIKPNVIDHEPLIALFPLGNDPLIFYKKIINFCKKSLKSQGILYLEINPIFVNGLKLLFSDGEFKNLEIKKDFNSKNRFLRVVKK